MSEKPPRVYLSPPHMNAREREFLLAAFDSNWIAPIGPDLNAFEQELADKVGVAHSAGVSSGTAGLHLALQLLGVGAGDEVFVSTFTFAASVNPVRYQGATPVLIDSDRTTWNMDPNLLEEALKERAEKGTLPKAVIVVDLYGQSADYDAIIPLCRSYGVPVVEDAAEALGATFQGRQAGSFGDIGIFSFNGNKIITTSGGGMFVSDNEHWVERARHLATQARENTAHYEHAEVGYNYRLSNLLAALGRGQLHDLDNKVDKKRAIFEAYRERLGDFPGIAFMPQDPRGRSNCWLSCLTIDPSVAGLNRENVRLALEEENIESRALWKPMHMQPVFTSFPSVGGRVARDLFETGLCLPSGTSLSSTDFERTVAVVEALLRDT
jgi:dTDP-4-amino-4,6-dideoxygalactose transaminase